MTVPVGSDQATQTGLDLTSASLVLATMQDDRSGNFVRAAVPSVGTISFTVLLNKKVATPTKVGWMVVRLTLRGRCRGPVREPFRGRLTGGPAGLSLRRGCSSVVEHLLCTQGVAGSNPVISTTAFPCGIGLAALPMRG